MRSCALWARGWVWAYVHTVWSLRRLACEVSDPGVSLRSLLGFLITAVATARRRKERERETDRQRERERERERETERQRETERDRGRERERQRETERDRERQRETERDRERQRETERDRERQKERERELRGGRGVNVGTAIGKQNMQRSTCPLSLNAEPYTLNPNP